MSRRISLQTQTLAEQLQTACVLECAARKPGNVHPQAAFADCRFEDFLRSAEIIAPLLAQGSKTGVGRAILASVQAVRSAVGTNTNLGMILLLAPLEAVPESLRCGEGIPDVLRRLTWEDSAQIYEAIRLARPGGLGLAERGDVRQGETLPILEAMALASERDLIARQYVTNFADVCELGRETFLRWTRRLDWEAAIIGTQLELLARRPDTLIARKCGMETAAESQRRARLVLEAGWPHETGAALALSQFDAWLRGDGHRRNPGATADLIAAILFATIRDGAWAPPADIEV